MSGRPDSMRCASRSPATVENDAGGIVGKPVGLRGPPLAPEGAARLEVVRAVQHPPDHVPFRPARPNGSARRRESPDRSHPRPPPARRWPAHAEAIPATARPAPSARAWPAPRRGTRRAATLPAPTAPRSAAEMRIRSAQPSASAATRSMWAARSGDTSAHEGSPLARGHPSRPWPRMMLSISRVRPSRAASATTVSAPTVSTGASVRRLHDGDVLHLHRGLGREHAAHGAQQHRRAPLARPERLVRGAERGAQHHRPPPVVGVEIGVPAAEREPVGLPHRRHDDDLQPPVQVAHHLPHQRRLLDVLPPEARHVGLDQMKELRDDRQHAFEVAGPGRALPPVRGRARAPRGSPSRAGTSPPRSARTARRRRAPRPGRGRAAGRGGSGRGPRPARTAAG